MSNYPVCPRCGGWIPNALQPGEYPGALSRVDNVTEICSSCGTEEAMLGLPRPMLCPSCRGRGQTGRPDTPDTCGPCHGTGQVRHAG